MKTKLMAGLLLAASGLMAAPRFSIGVGVGVPAGGYGYVAPAPVVVAPPAPVYAAPVYPAPGPGYTWMSGFWFGEGPRRVWRPGYWAAPRYGRFDHDRFRR